jgi:hypothetical protein
VENGAKGVAGEMLLSPVRQRAWVSSFVKAASRNADHLGGAASGRADVSTPVAVADTAGQLALSREVAMKVGESECAGSEIRPVEPGEMFASLASVIWVRE